MESARETLERFLNELEGEEQQASLTWPKGGLQPAATGCFVPELVRP